MSLLDVETDVEDPRSFATLSSLNQLVASPRWAQQYEVVVATSAMTCKKGFAPHTGARAIPPTLLDTKAGGPAGPAAAGPIFGQKKKKKKRGAHPCEQLRMSIHDDDDDVCNK